MTVSEAAAERLHTQYADELRQSLRPPVHPMVNARQTRAMIRRAREGGPGCASARILAVWPEFVCFRVRPEFVCLPTVLPPPFRSRQSPRSLRRRKTDATIVGEPTTKGLDVDHIPPLCA